MEQRLKESAEAGDISSLYALIKQDPYTLERIAEIPFADTPLHAATSAGQTLFAIEIISLKPSFGRTLNADGLTPLDLALQNGHSETVRRLVKFDAGLIRVKGRESYTPLHYVAEIDSIDHLAEFLYACPGSIKDLTIRDESALHIAVKNSRLRAFNVLLGWLSRTLDKEVLNWRDGDGNTALHMAVATNQVQVVNMLIYKGVRTNFKNQEGFTPLDLALTLQNNQEVRKILLRAKAFESSHSRKTFSLAEFLISKERYYEIILKHLFLCQRDFTMDKQNIILVVVVLITTATYQSVLSPPGGVWQAQVDSNPPNYSIIFPNGSLPNPMVNNISVVPLWQTQSSNSAAGKVITDGENLLIFYWTNATVFTLSILVLLITLPRTPSTFLVDMCLGSLWLSYSVSFAIIAPWNFNDLVLRDVCTLILLLGCYAWLCFSTILGFKRNSDHYRSPLDARRNMGATRLQQLLGLLRR